MSAAPAATSLLCLLVISLQSLICRFTNLFSNCWHKSEWSRKPRQASVSVAFRAAALTKCLFSLRGEEEGPTESCLDDAFVNKNPECPGFLFLCFAPPCLCVQNDWLREPWEYGWHRSRPGFPSCRCRSQLWRAMSGQQGTTGEGVQIHNTYNPFCTKFISFHHKWTSPMLPVGGILKPEWSPDHFGRMVFLPDFVFVDKQQQQQWVTSSVSVSQHQVLFYKRDASFKSNHPEDKLSIADQSG